MRSEHTNMLKLTVMWTFTLDGMMMRSNVIAGHQIEIYKNEGKIVRFDGAEVCWKVMNWGSRAEKRKHMTMWLAKILQGET